MKARATACNDLTRWTGRSKARPLLVRKEILSKLQVAVWQGAFAAALRRRPAWGDAGASIGWRDHGSRWWEHQWEALWQLV